MMASAFKSVNPVSDTIRIGPIRGLTRACLLQMMKLKRMRKPKKTKRLKKTKRRNALRVKRKMATCATADVRMARLILVL